jgi:hypothetical protein
MESKERKKWEALTDEQRDMLLGIIEVFKGHYVERDEFSETMGQLLEDVPGLEILSESKRATFLNELWRMYSWRKRKLRQRNRPK